MIATALMPPDGRFWYVVGKFEGSAARLADRHYPRRRHGSRQFMPPGQTLVLVTADDRAVFGWHRPDPASGVKRMDGLDGWCCSIFRNERERERGASAVPSSAMILDAERLLADRHDCGPDGLFTYVEPGKIRSVNTGCCFQRAGWRKTERWSADGKKRLLVKRWVCAGVPPEAAKGLRAFVEWARRTAA